VKNALELSPRERDILPYIVLGKSNREIGDALGIKETTVKFYMKELFKLAHVESRTQLALWARRGGLA
jgi:two-component system nitrate/nitrite response regulator NarL